MLQILQCSPSCGLLAGTGPCELPLCNGSGLETQETDDSPDGPQSWAQLNPGMMTRQSFSETRMPSTAESVVTWLLSQNIHLGRDKEIAGLNLLLAIF